MEAYATFAGSAGIIVKYPEPMEHANRFVVHVDREVDVRGSPRIAKVLDHPLLEIIDPVECPIELLLGDVVGVEVFLRGRHARLGGRFAVVGDRIVAADTLSVITTAGIAGLAVVLDNPLYLDIALIYGVLAFVAVVALARAIEGNRS